MNLFVELIRIMLKRSEEQRSSLQTRGFKDEGQVSQNNFNSYEQYFNYPGGSRFNLSD